MLILVSLFILQSCYARQKFAFHLHMPCHAVFYSVYFLFSYLATCLFSPMQCFILKIYSNTHNMYMYVGFFSLCHLNKNILYVCISLCIMVKSTSSTKPTCFIIVIIITTTVSPFYTIIIVYTYMYVSVRGRMNVELS